MGLWGVVRVGTILSRGIADCKVIAVLDDDIVHVDGLEVGEVFRERNEMVGFFGSVELEKVRPVGVVVAGPAELGESLLELGVGSYDVVRREVDQDSGTCARCCGCAWVGWFLMLEGLASRPKVCQFQFKMSHTREEKDYHSSESELEDYKYKYYKELRDGRVRVRVSEKFFRCPYCPDKKRKEYDYNELLRHSSHIGRDSKSARLKDRGRHLGLVKYLERHVEAKGKSSRSTTKNNERGRHTDVKRKSSLSTMRTTEVVKSYTDGKSPSLRSSLRSIDHPESNDMKGTVRQSVTGATDLVERYIDAEGAALGSTKKTTKPEEDAKNTPEWSSVRTSEPCRLQSTAETVGPSKRKATEELIVWPWMAIVANIPVEYKVHPLWNYRGHSGYAIVEFNNDWDGFKNAMTFEKAFEIENHGRRDWYASRNKEDKLYSWVARDVEYYSKGLIGEYLRKNGDLKTISEIETEDKRKDTKLVSNLTYELEVKNRQCEEMNSKISRTEFFLKNVMKQKEEMIEAYNEEMKALQQGACDQLEKIFIDHERSKSQLEAQREVLEMREKELWERQALNESEKRKLSNEKKMNERAILEQKKADENMLKLAEQQKRQKEKLHKRIIELEKKLDAKQALELEIERMRGAIQVMKHMGEDGDMEVKRKMESIQKDLKEKEEDLDGLEALNQALIVKERKSNDELQEARKELINIK
ncbi:hypothetical protein F0562_021953 [Nyssa sinensis]|uniref:XS domain-containing protein n=1 Tax=Nyssa sinensis TaxID=561372 RepID=A0A5J5BP01_9ASTE|nr:hypothetical protein F0562_021953 [Nyssa sinensis]